MSQGAGRNRNAKSGGGRNNKGRGGRNDQSKPQRNVQLPIQFVFGREQQQQSSRPRRSSDLETINKEVGRLLAESKKRTAPEIPESANTKEIRDFINSAQRDLHRAIDLAKDLLDKNTQLEHEKAVLQQELKLASADANSSNSALSEVGATYQSIGTHLESVIKVLLQDRDEMYRRSELIRTGRGATTSASEASAAPAAEGASANGGEGSKRQKRGRGEKKPEGDASTGEAAATENKAAENATGSEPTSTEGATANGERKPQREKSGGRGNTRGKGGAKKGGEQAEGAAAGAEKKEEVTSSTEATPAVAETSAATPAVETPSS